MYNNSLNGNHFNYSSTQPFLKNSIIITPYEKVLSILNSVKQYINSTSSYQSKLIRDLDWVIKVITSHSLYAYELKEKDLINKLTNENEDFKQFVDFVSKYNEQVIEMNKKNIFWGARTIEVANELLQKPSINLRKQIYNSQKNNNPASKSPKKMRYIKSYNILGKNESINLTNEKNKIYTVSLLNGQDKLKTDNTINTEKLENKFKPIYKSGKNLIFNKISSSVNQVTETNNKKKKGNSKDPKTFHSDINKLKTPQKFTKKKINSSVINISRNINSKNKTKSTLINTNSNRDITNFLTNSTLVNSNSNHTINNITNSARNRHNRINGIYKINSDNIEKFNNSELGKIRDSVQMNNEKISLPYNSSFNAISLINLQGKLNKANFDRKLIMEKEFNIFEFEKIVGHKNVLPIMGRTMLESFGLIDEEIMPVEKLDPFLISVTEQYLTSTLYHNSLHGADVTATICLFFNNSNAEEVCHAQVIDLLSIIIAALGHDVGHPGLTNAFQINSSSEMAITYNDNSCLENFHLTKLFKTLRKDEHNIFEKLSIQDYKKIRKRMISEILATDMAIHGKVLNNIRSKIPDELLNETEKNKKTGIQKFELITDINNEETTNEEKQALFDYFIHSADLGHNTKIFDISLRWVELLSEEFWLQGDKERQINLSISFLCDRDTTNVPKSQVGFIGGFIIPSYNFLVIMFPTLSYTIENAKTNLNKWQKLADEGRKRGWTPDKKRKDKNIIRNFENLQKYKFKKDKNSKKKANVVEIILD